MASNVTQQGLPQDTVDREHVKAVMRSRGLLVEPSPQTLASAAQSTLTLDEAAAILSRGDGPTFSQQIDEERGPRG